MEDAQIPFDIFDDDLVAAADEDLLRQGVLAMGNARYTSLVIPPCQYMPAATIARLESFISGGGKVFRTTCPEWDKALQSPLTFIEDTTGIRLAQRAPENGKLFLISNDNLESSTVSVCLPEDNGYRLELTTGNIYSAGKAGETLTLQLQSGEMVGLLFTEDILETQEKTEYAKEMVLEDHFTLRRTERFVVGSMKSTNEKICEEAESIALGDWETVAGREFSGSCLYETEFTAPREIGEKAILDLGDVRYTCEAFLNSKSLGVKVMSPYRYEILAEDLKEVNQLQIRVTNTPANEFNSTKALDLWPDWQLSPYWKTAKIFQEESICGGLYGPVKILY